MVRVARRIGQALLVTVGLSLLLAVAPALAKKKADLVEKRVLAPSTATAGDTFEVTDTAKNKGKKRAGKTVMGFVLSKDDSAGDGDVALTGSRHVPKLKPHEKSSGITALGVPADTKAGAWFVLACADAEDAVKEKSETNNCKAAADPVSIAPAKVAKLSVNPASWDYGTIFAGAAFSKDFTVTNPGTAPTSALSVVISGPNSEAFAIFPGTSNCPGKVLQPAASCVVTVSFGSNTEDTYNGSLDVSATVGGAVHVPLSGTVNGSPP